jgi:hypothetical protein
MRLSQSRAAVPKISKSCTSANEISLLISFNGFLRFRGTKETTARHTHEKIKMCHYFSPSFDMVGAKAKIQINIVWTNFVT